MFQVLQKLKLKLSPAKTKMGRLKHGFHFLGVDYQVTRIPGSKIHLNATVHSRTCARAMDQIIALQDDAVNPAIRQRYLIRWATWWSHTIQTNQTNNVLFDWVRFAQARCPTVAWLGRGLLPYQISLLDCNALFI